MAKIIAIMALCLLALHAGQVNALTASEAKDAWLEAKTASAEMQEQHRNAKVDWAANKTSENERRVVDTGKDVLSAALDEADAWLVWAELNALENPEIPESLKTEISADVAANREKVAELRGDVEGISNRFETGIVFLKMVGKYAELLTDVARNTGLAWVSVGESKADTVERYELKLRSAAERMENNVGIISELDGARADLDEARRSLAMAESAYRQVRTPGTPLIKFGEGNNYLRTAQSNLLSAHAGLNRAYALMVQHNADK